MVKVIDCNLDSVGDSVYICPEPIDLLDRRDLLKIKDKLVRLACFGFLDRRVLSGSSHFTSPHSPSIVNVSVAERPKLLRDPLKYGKEPFLPWLIERSVDYQPFGDHHAGLKTIYAG